MENDVKFEIFLIDNLPPKRKESSNRHAAKK